MLLYADGRADTRWEWKHQNYTDTTLYVYTKKTRIVPGDQEKHAHAVSEQANQVKHWEYASGGR